MTPTFAMIPLWLALLLPIAGTPVVDLGYAQYSGTFNTTSGNTIFLGMRFAAPPTGNLRWRAPGSPAFVAGVQPADIQPPMCISGSQGSAPTSPFRTMSLESRAAAATSEDCLFLNVFTPIRPGIPTLLQKKLLVVFWIHGGGYASGSAATYDGEDLIREAGGGVVAVVIQYRLGLFGFLPGNKINADGSLNTGLLDQHAALLWVRQHIDKFGGDPSKVTIWGESAGAGSVLQHIIAQDGKTTPPLFRAAITSSTFLPSQYKFDDPIPEALYSEVASQMNCSTATDSLACLRAVDIDLLQAANLNISKSGFFGTYVFVPVVDGTFITQRPTEALKQRKVNGDVLLTVTNTFEGAAFVDASTAPTVQVPEYISQLFPNFGSQELATATSLYQSLGSPIFQVIAIMGEAIFICPTYYLLRAFDGRSFKGEFAIPPGGHGQDISYYFPSQNPSGVPAFNNAAFDKAFSESFLNFAMSLDPNIKSDPLNITPRWDKWAGEVEMLFNRTEAGEPIVNSVITSDALLARCNFWESAGALSGQ